MTFVRPWKVEENKFLVRIGVGVGNNNIIEMASAIRGRLTFIGRKYVKSILKSPCITNPKILRTNLACLHTSRVFNGKL